MQRKKILSLTLAAAMILGSSFSVSAATGTGENTSGETITGSGEVEYLDTTIYSVTLPTTNASAKFTVDPLGLTNMEGDSATLEELSGNAGKVFMADKPVISNVSSVPMKVSVELTLTGDATAVTSMDDVTSGDTNNILLYAVPSAADVEGDAENFAGSATGIVLGTTATTIDFILPAADYVVKKGGTESAPTYTYELAKAGDLGHGTAIAFRGLVNKNADWADYAAGATTPKTIGLTAKFTFTNTIAAGDVADTTAGAPYGMKAYSGDTVALVADDIAPIFTADTSKAGLITFKKGAGASGLVTVDKVEHQYAGKWYVADNAAVTVAGNAIQYSDSIISSMAAQGATFGVRVTYTNSTGSQVVSPVIAVNTATVDAAPVFTASETLGLITYSAGGGALGIASIDKVEHQYSGTWSTSDSTLATVDTTACTIQYTSQVITTMAAKGSTFNVRITYTNSNGEVKTETIAVKCKA